MKKMFMIGMLLSVLILSGCGTFIKPIEPIVVVPKPELKSIAYDGDNIANRVYIQEGEIYVPYLVIGNRYESEIVLLREYLLDRPTVYSFKQIEGSGGGYYSNENLDSELNKVFLQTLDPNVQRAILKLPIRITSLDGIGQGNNASKTELIDRKIYLLSATELNFETSKTSKEGKFFSMQGFNFPVSKFLTKSKFSIFISIPQEPVVANLS